MKNRRVVMLPSVGAPPVGDMADLILARLAQEQPIQKPAGGESTHQHSGDVS